MRRTMYLLASKELAIFVRGSGRRAEKEIRWMLAKGVSEGSLRELVDGVLQSLERPLTPSALAERVSESLGLRMQFKRGGGWGSGRMVACVKIGRLACPAVYLMHLAGARGVICSVPGQDNQSNFVRADKWIPQWRDISVEQAERELLRRYLQAFGPATASDFALWAGMRISDAEEIWSREAADITEVNVEGWKAAILQSDLHQLETAKLEQPTVNLLPYFDSFLLGHKERRHIVEARNHRRVYRPHGWVYPVVLVNGRAVGTWFQAQNNKLLDVRIEPFVPLSPQVSSRLRDEAANLGRFLECSDVNTRII